MHPNSAVMSSLVVSLNYSLLFGKLIMKLYTTFAILGLTSVMATTSVYADHHKELLTDNKGMTLYTFDKDSKNKSACYDDCAVKWPPYLASKYAKAKWGFKIITRDDGSKQWAYKGKPLYTWIGDKEVGQMTGDGVGGVWHIATKKAAKPAQNNQSSGGGY